MCATPNSDYIFVTFFHFVNLDMLGLRYYGILFAQLLQFYTDLFETWQMLLSGHVDVHMIYIYIIRRIFGHIFRRCEIKQFSA